MYLFKPGKLQYKTIIHKDKSAYVWSFQQTLWRNNVLKLSLWSLGNPFNLSSKSLFVFGICRGCATEIKNTCSSVGFYNVNSFTILPWFKPYVIQKIMIPKGKVQVFACTDTFVTVNIVHVFVDVCSSFIIMATTVGWRRLREIYGWMESFDYLCYLRFIGSFRHAFTWSKS